jgi:hypothetical protein
LSRRPRLARSREEELAACILLARKALLERIALDTRWRRIIDVAPGTVVLGSLLAVFLTPVLGTVSCVGFNITRWKPMPEGSWFYTWPICALTGFVIASVVELMALYNTWNRLDVDPFPVHRERLLLKEVQRLYPTVTEAEFTAGNDYLYEAESEVVEQECEQCKGCGFVYSDECLRCKGFGTIFSRDTPDWWPYCLDRFRHPFDRKTILFAWSALLLIVHLALAIYLWPKSAPLQTQISTAPTSVAATLPDSHAAVVPPIKGAGLPEPPTETAPPARMEMPFEVFTLRLGEWKDTGLAVGPNEQVSVLASEPTANFLIATNRSAFSTTGSGIVSLPVLAETQGTLKIRLFSADVRGPVTFQVKLSDANQNIIEGKP